MIYIPELCGYVASRDENLKTSRNDIYIAGDVSGIEEASSAMLEGQIAGLNAAVSLGLYYENYQQLNHTFHKRLAELRNNTISENINRGIKKATLIGGESHVCSY